MHGGDIYSNEIKHDFSVNINPFGPYENVVKAIHDSIDHVVNYPENLAGSLSKKVQDSLCISNAQVVITNGASEAINVIVKTLGDRNLIIESPAFLGYDYAAAFLKNKHYYRRNSILKLNDQIIDEGSLIILANPSNPLGDFTEHFKLDALYERIKSTNSFMMLDESFLPLSDHEGESFIKKIDENPRYYDRVIVVRSFTKSFSIPGVRLGYFVTSNAEIAEILSRSLPEWNISVMALAAGEECLNTVSRLGDDAKKIKTLRLKLEKKLNDIGCKSYKSCANYIVFIAPRDLYSRLLERGILIRDCSDYSAIDDVKSEIFYSNINPEEGYNIRNLGVFRTAVKTEEENNILIDAIKEVLNK